MRWLSRRSVLPVILTIGGAGLLILAAAWLVQATRDEPQAGRRQDNLGAGGLQFPRLNVVVYGNRTPQATFTALNASRSPDGVTVQCGAVRDGKFYQSGRVVAQFTAGQATYNQTSEDLDLSGPIAVDAANGVHLRCGSLHYTHATNRLRVQGPLTISTPNTVFTAGRLDADLALNELRFESVPGQPVRLTSRRAQVR